ncbi:YugN family protein [Salirhabdus sp. Marseille-P4669]|uniref:YugN family protein n=1 Tax=Salirhabdus sp. Marseille-P4669 TaxID=2042310 RepID=UPI000C79D202|nr:YugN family protein [Salirhabdus sp. Marseille-P4669]
MKFEETGIEGAVVDLRPLDYLMKKAGFVRASGWDYERVTYDYKMNTSVKNETYYLRVQGHALEGNVDKGTALIELLTPVLGKHYYPHGIEYDEEFPNNIVQRCNGILNNVKELLDTYKEENK